MKSGKDQGQNEISIGADKGLKEEPLPDPKQAERPFAQALKIGDSRCDGRHVPVNCPAKEFS
ncbi:hypothetical protein [Novosphingobium sp.]|jgi:hypothetical protein|uniref:hypothetical protein n=1 Tax=Novosphingobium sp. TaxID=1874826 RepID=UPI0031D4207B